MNKILISSFFAISLCIIGTGCAEKLYAFGSVEEAQVVHVGVDYGYETIKEALSLVKDGDTLLIHSGIYPEHELVVTASIFIIGKNRPVIDAEFQGAGMIVRSNEIHIEGLAFRNIPISHSRDFAALRLERVQAGNILNNHFSDTFFGIYIARSQDIIIENNVLEAFQDRESQAANGIHLWNSNRIQVKENRIKGHRDGIYLEYVSDSRIDHNFTENSIRYGLHFMFSDRCVYEANTFVNNGAGVAVMYSRHVLMKNNRFEDNWGASSYGLLLKDISDSEIVGNAFINNTIGIRSEGSDRVRIYENIFRQNGWAVRIMASSMKNHFYRNNFIHNAFDVSTNSRKTNSTFEENYWDKYSGYDLVGDGFGDVPYRPVRLFSLIVEQNPISLILLRSFFVDMLDLAERVMPTITPGMLVDEKPQMRALSL